MYAALVSASAVKGGRAAVNICPTGGLRVFKVQQTWAGRQQLLHVIGSEARALRDAPTSHKVISDEEGRVLRHKTLADTPSPPSTILWRIQLPNLTTPTVWGDNTFTGFYVKVTDVVELYGHRVRAGMQDIVRMDPTSYQHEDVMKATVHGVYKVDSTSNLVDSPVTVRELTTILAAN